MILGQAKRHQLLERDFVLPIGCEQDRARLGEAKTLLDDGRRHAEGGGDGLLALALIGERFEGSELVEGMQRLAFDVLGKAVGFDKAAGPDDAGDGRVFCQLLLLDEELQGAQAAAAGLDAVFARLFASLVVEGAHAQALQEAASLDVGGKAGNGSVRLNMAGVAVVQDELIEGNACGLSQPDFLFGLGHNYAPLIEGSGLRPSALALGLGPSHFPFATLPLARLLLPGRHRNRGSPLLRFEADQVLRARRSRASCRAAIEF